MESGVDCTDVAFTLGGGCDSITDCVPLVFASGIGIGIDGAVMLVLVRVDDLCSRVALAEDVVETESSGWLALD